MPFQSQVNVEPAIGVPGDFASNNPYGTVLAGEGALVAGPAGLTVASFGWIQADGQTVMNAPPSGSTAAPDGFVHRDLQALINNLLSEATMTLPGGYMATLYCAGDFLAVSSTATTRGQKVFASTTNGAISTAAAGSSVSGAVETNFYVGTNNAAGETFKMTTWDHH